MAEVFSQQLRSLIEQAKRDGVEVIPCDGLLKIIDDLDIQPGGDVAGTEDAKYNAHLQAWIEENKAYHNSKLEMFRSVITSGQNALRSAFLLNGGAAIAMLAFIGKLTDQHPERVACFAEPLLVFVAGVLATAVASGTTYLSQWFYAAEPGWKQKTGFNLNILSIVLGLSSYGIFVLAMILAYLAFQQFSG